MQNNELFDQMIDQAETKKNQLFDILVDSNDKEVWGKYAPEYAELRDSINYAKMVKDYDNHGLFDHLPEENQYFIKNVVDKSPTAPDVSLSDITNPINSSLQLTQAGGMDYLNQLRQKNSNDFELFRRVQADPNVPQHAKNRLKADLVRNVENTSRFAKNLGAIGRAGDPALGVLDYGANVKEHGLAEGTAITGFSELVSQAAKSITKNIGIPKTLGTSTSIGSGALGGYLLLKTLEETL